MCMMMPSGGTKQDQGKTRYDLIAPDALDGMARILTYGANKYGDRNWEDGLAWGRVFAAMMRHAWAFWNGEDLDPESGLPHIDHVQCCAHFLSRYSKQNQEFDDRPKGGKMDLLEKEVKLLISKVARVSMHKIKDQTVLMEDLRMDPIQMTELGIELETRFRVEVPTEDAQAFIEARDVTEYIRKKTGRTK